MPTEKQLKEQSWPKRLLAAIAYQAAVDYAAGNIGLCDSSCIPANSSTEECKRFVAEAEEFFRGTKYEKVLPRIRQAVPAFVEGLRTTRPRGPESQGYFNCPNCGGKVFVRWLSEESGIIKGKCSGCMFQSVYRIPQKELKERWNSDGSSAPSAR